MIRSTTRVTTLLAVGVLALAGCSGGGEDPAPSPSQEAPAVSDGGSANPAPSAAEPTDESGEEGSECAADDSDQDVPTEAPEADAWPNVNGIGTPVSDTHGPTQRDEDVWTCFSHSPTGALFAAAYLQSAIVDPAVREAYITDDPDVESGQGSDASGTVLRGFRITAYDENTAVVELVYEGSAGGESGLAVLPTTLHWKDGHWTSTQADFAAAETRTVTGLSGFTQWGVGS